MKTNRTKFVSLGTGALLALSGATVADDGSVGSVQLGAGSLSVLPAVSYAEMQVTISGESVHWQKSYEPGEVVSLSFTEVGSLVDGNYSYEVIAAPAVDEAAWAAAEGDADRERELERAENANTHIQSGAFEVAGGFIQQTAEPAGGMK